MNLLKLNRSALSKIKFKNCLFLEDGNKFIEGQADELCRLIYRLVYETAIPPRLVKKIYFSLLHLKIQLKSYQKNLKLSF